MSALLTKAKEQILIYWMVGFYVFLFSGVALGTSWQTATAGVNWSEADHDSKVRMIVGILVTWGTVMMAFLNKATSKVLQGELPIGEERTFERSTKATDETGKVTEENVKQSITAATPTTPEVPAQPKEIKL
jgi:hypothetical protein